MKAIAYISFGSNLGDREQNITTALHLIEQDHSIKLNRISNLYETEPVGYKNQDWFLNGVARIETLLLPKELLDRLQGIERKLGKEIKIKWGPRTIDLDILLYSNTILDLPELQIPHSLMHKRAFVLVPLSQIAPNVLHPVLNKTIKVLLTNLKYKEEVIKR